MLIIFLHPLLSKCKQISSRTVPPTSLHFVRVQCQGPICQEPPKQKCLPPLLPPPLCRQREIPLLQAPPHPSHSLLLLKFSMDSIIAPRVQAANLFPIFDQRNLVKVIITFGSLLLPLPSDQLLS